MTRPCFNRIAPAAAVALVAALAGCTGGDIEINGQTGVPLAEVEIAGPPPSEVILSSGDTVILTEGDTFALTVEGADTESLRFVRDEQVIGITRTNGWSGNQTATIRITMPPPSEIVIGGSGTVEAQSLAATSEISIGGSGTVSVAKIAAEKLGINIGGSGTVNGAGTAKQLEINIGGSGDIKLAGLKADSAEVSIGGSGDVAFASDGKVEANIAGAGDVKVAGNATCTINALGSGTLTCTPTTGAAAKPSTPIAATPAE